MLKRWKKEKDNEAVTDVTKKDRINLVRLLSLVAITMVVFAVYRFFLNHRFFLAIMFAYMAIFTVLVFTYVIYNRGFSRRNITPDMLPAEWSEAEKEAFIENGRERTRKSHWMLMLIIAFGFTFAFDMMELFVVPFFKNLFFK